MYRFAYRGSLILYFSLLAKPGHPLPSERDQFKIKHLFPSLPKGSCCYAVSQDTCPRKHRSLMMCLPWLLSSLTCRKAMYCTFGISNHSSSWQPLSYKEVSKPLDTATYPELHGRAFQHSSSLLYSSGAQETLFIARLTFPSELLALQ